MRRKSVEKVLAYVTRGRELLVFAHRDHPEAGIQVPAGTVDPGESPEEAVARELREESGLGLAGGVLLGRFEWVREDRNELHHRSVFHFPAGSGLADSWEHVVQGGGGDDGLVFRYFWLPIEEARTALAAEQGAYVGKLG